MHIPLYFISVPLYHMHHNHEWLREYYLTLNEQLFTYYMARTSYSRCYDNAVRFILVQLPYLEFILVQLPYLEFYSASSMKLQSAGRWFVDWYDFTDIHVLWIHCICDLMVIALPLTYVGDRVIEPMSNQAKHYQIGIYNLSIKSAPFISRVRFIVFNATSKQYFSYIVIRSENTSCIFCFSAMQAALRSM
jgi:hypothetical protein